MRLHTGHCPSYTVYSGLQPLCSKVHAYYYYTVSGLAVCLLLFFFIYLGKRLSQKRLGVRPKYGWTRFFSLVYGLAFHFPGTFSLQNGSSPRSSCLILLSTTTTNINIPKVCFFWCGGLDSYMQPSVKHPRFQGCAALEATRKRLLSTYILQTILAKSFAKIFDQLHWFSEVQSTLSSVYKQPKKLTISLCCLNFSQIWLVLLLICCLIFVMPITFEPFHMNFYKKNP